MTDNGEFPYVRMEPKTRETVTLVRTCETCRWWNSADSAQPSWADCSRAYSYEGEAADEKSLAVAFAFDEHIMAKLFTRRDFGCVQWEARDDG